MANIKRSSNVTPEMLIVARNKAGLDTKEAAALIGKSRRTYQYYESGKVSPTQHDYEQILRFKR